MDRHEKAMQLLHCGTVIPAIPLALHSDRTLDEEGQRTLIRYYLAAGVGGLAVAVHTTQFEIRKPEIGLFNRSCGWLPRRSTPSRPAPAGPLSVWPAPAAIPPRPAKRPKRPGTWGLTPYCSVPAGWQT